MPSARNKVFWNGAFRNERAKCPHWSCKGLCCKGAERKHKKHETAAIKEEGSGEQKITPVGESGFFWWILFHLEGSGKAVPLMSVAAFTSVAVYFKHSIKWISQHGFRSLELHTPCVPHNIYIAQKQLSAVYWRAMSCLRKNPSTGNHMAQLQLCSCKTTADDESWERCLMCIQHMSSLSAWLIIFNICELLRDLQRKRTREAFRGRSPSQRPPVGHPQDSGVTHSQFALWLTNLELHKQALPEAELFLKVWGEKKV